MAVVVVAGSACCTGLVVQGIAQYDDLCNGAAQLGGANAYASSVAAEAAVTVDLHAKYYDAAVAFKPCSDTSDGNGWDAQLRAADVASPVEGLIFVTDSDVLVDATKACLADAAGAASRLNVKLLVHVQWSGAAELSDAERLARTEWCLDHGFELVEVDAADPVRNWKDREKEGLPRLVEALHSTMWSSMVRKDKPTTTVFARAEAAAATTATATAMAAPAPAPVPATAPATASTTKTATSSAVKITDPAQGSAAPAARVLTVTSADSITLEQVDEEDDDPDGEDAMLAQLEEVISQAREYRQQAVDGAVPDEERLRRAEHVARALAAMLHLDDDDDDDD